jgi:hypothetical protein
VIATTLYRGLARPLFRALSGVVSAITKVLIDLSPTSNGFYSLGTPVVFAADFEIEIDFVSSTQGENQHLTGAVSSNRYEILFVSNNALVVYDGSIGAQVHSIAGLPYLDGKKHTIKATRAGGLQSLFIDGTPVASATKAVGNVTIDCLGSRERTTNFFGGILSDPKLTDITTPANSLEFKLDQLTANTETNNGVTLTYQNIGTGIDVRDTYTLIDGDYIGSDLVTNGDFAVDADWTLQSNWSISAGKLRKVNNGSDNRSYQAGVIRADLDYRFGFDLDVNSGGLSGDTGLGSAGIGSDITTSGSYVFDLTTQDANSLSIKGTSNFDGSVDNVFTYRTIDIAAQA